MQYFMPDRIGKKKASADFIKACRDEVEELICKIENKHYVNLFDERKRAEDLCDAIKGMNIFDATNYTTKLETEILERYLNNEDIDESEKSIQEVWWD